MVTLLLKKSYRHKDLKEIKFHDLWNSYGVFTTMRVIEKPAKIIFFKEHINNLIRSLKVYKINKKNIKQNIFKLIKLNLNKNKKYDHLFRVAVNNKMISISLRKRDAIIRCLGGVKRLIYPRFWRRLVPAGGRILVSGVSWPGA